MSDISLFSELSDISATSPLSVVADMSEASPDGQTSSIAASFLRPTRAWF